jgi:hypothetical protein
MNTARLKTWALVLVFSVLPLAVTLLLHYLHGWTSLEKVCANAPEMLFVTIIVPITAWNDVRVHKTKDEVSGWNGMQIALIVCSVLGAILYGIHADSLVQGDPYQKRQRLYSISKWFFLFSLIGTTFIECMLAHAEANAS